MCRSAQWLLSLTSLALGSLVELGYSAICGDFDSVALSAKSFEVNGPLSQSRSGVYGVRALILPLPTGRVHV